MTTLTPSTSDPPQAHSPRRTRFLSHLRPWIQTAFLAVFLWPYQWVTQALAALGINFNPHMIPGCVFHCYACPLSTFACPVGIVAQSVAHGFVPFLALGVVITTGALLGSLACGWACPFGFLQDILARVPLPKLRIPAWMSHGRYLVLLFLVILIPWRFGSDHPLFICSVCPAGGLEAGVYDQVSRHGLAGLLAMSPTKTAIVLLFLGWATLTIRPWCTIFCPLGGFFALFNRVSIFYLRFAKTSCTACNLCRSRCAYGVEVEKSVNVSRCLRCMECTTCGAFEPALAIAKPQEHPPD